jgi:ribosome-associated toxin RatA of RatAB toxin-antitoxin module
MRIIQACDKIELNKSIDEVWNVLIDIPSYHKWWPKVVNIEVSNFSDKIVETLFVVKQFGGQSFSCRVETLTPKKEIKLNYFEGLYRGEGKWELKSKSNSTIISYSVDLIIVNKLIVFLSYILPISKIHSLIFMKIFSGLKEYLLNRQS